MVRIALPKYGPLTAPERIKGTPPEQWGRFDSPGLTLYTAETRDTAYAEVLSQFKRQIGGKDPLEADATALGMSREEFLEEVADQWAASMFMGVGAIPASWRHDRGLYLVYAVSGGWWIDIDHPDSISHIEVALESLLIEEGIASITTAVLEGENRRVTTAVGELLRRVELDDGTKARGLQFRSKHGGAWCRAIWLPSVADVWDAGLTALSPEQIRVTDEFLAQACERFRIKVF